MAHPLNEDPSHPLSVAKGYAPIYAPGTKITNAEGKQEDLVVTWAEDAAQAHKVFPGLPEGEKLYLERPNAAGLSAVRDGTGQALQFMPGQTFAVRTGASSLWNSKAGLENQVVPTDPKEAAEFFKRTLGPGWFVQQDGYLGDKGQGYTLCYGGRLKFGERERDAAIAQRGKDTMQFRQDAQGATGTVDLPGGAAIRYPNATGSAGAAARANSDTTDNGSSWSEVGGAISGAAGAAKDKYVDIAGQQVGRLATRRRRQARGQREGSAEGELSMDEHVEYRTTNGHTVLMDRADWLAIRPLLEAGVRLQSRMHVREGLRVLLREYGRGGEPQRTMLLSKALLGASAHQVVAMLNGPLYHRRSFMVLEDAGREQGWSSRVHSRAGTSRPSSSPSLIVGA